MRQMAAARFSSSTLVPLVTVRRSKSTPLRLTKAVSRQSLACAGRFVSMSRLVNDLNVPGGPGLSLTDLVAGRGQLADSDNERGFAALFHRL